MATSRKKKDPQGQEPDPNKVEEKKEITLESLLKGLNQAEGGTLFASPSQTKEEIRKHIETLAKDKELRDKLEREARIEATRLASPTGPGGIPNISIINSLTKQILNEKLEEQRQDKALSALEKEYKIRKKRQEIEDDELDRLIKRQQADQAGVTLPEKEDQAVANQTQVDRIANQLQQDPTGEISQAFIDLARQGGLVGRSPVSNLRSLQRQGFLGTRLAESISRLNEKDIRFSPFGRVGGLAGAGLNLVGSLIDLIIPGDQSDVAGIGTTLFGGRLPQAAQAKILSDVLFRSSPAARAEIEDIFSRERLGATSAASQAKLDGFPVAGGLVKDEDDLKIYKEHQLRLEDSLINNNEFFGAISKDIEGPLKEPWEIFKKLKGDLSDIDIQGENSPDVIKLLIKQMEDTKSVYRDLLTESIGGILKQGHSVETINSAIDQAQRHFKKILRDGLKAQELDFSATGSQTKNRALQNTTTNEFINNLEDFRNFVIPEIVKSEKLIKQMAEKAGIKPGKISEKQRSRIIDILVGAQQ